MPEHVFLNEGGIQVTTARFIAKGRTYVVNGVTSVSLYEIKPPRAWIFVCVLISIGGFIYGNAGVGIAFLVFAVVGWFANTPTYSVRLMTASGESDAFTAKDRSQVERVVHALNEAIVARG
jgi:hypothetical protein